GFEHKQIAQISDQVSHEPHHVLSAFALLMQQTDRFRCFAAQNPTCKIDYNLFACESENIEHVALVDFVSAKGDELISDRFRIAKAALRAARDRMRRTRLERDLLFLGNELQVLRNQIRGNAM